MFFSVLPQLKKRSACLHMHIYISTYDIRQPNAHVCLQIYASEDACNLLMGETAANQMLSLQTTAMYWLPVGSNYFQSIRIKKNKTTAMHWSENKQVSMFMSLGKYSNRNRGKRNKNPKSLRKRFYFIPAVLCWFNTLQCNCGSNDKKSTMKNWVVEA